MKMFKIFGKSPGNGQQADYDSFLTRSREGRNTFDDLLKYYIGHNSFWQYAIMILVASSNPSTLIFGNFVTSIHEHRCRQSVEDESWFMERNVTFDRLVEMLSADKYGCSSYNITPGEWPLAEAMTPDARERRFAKNPCTNGYVYKDSPYFYEDTIVKEFNMVCDRAYLMPLDTSFYMTGMLLGYVSAGILADRFGRKWTGFAYALAGFLFSVCLYFTKSLWSYLVIRLIIAGAGSATSTIMTVIAVEISTVESRSIFLSTWMIGQQFLSRVVHGVWAYFIKDWRLLQLIQFLPGGICIFYSCLLPESPRWLYSKGYFGQMRRVLATARQINSKTFGLPRCKLPMTMDHVIDNLQEEYERATPSVEETSLGEKVSAFFHNFFNAKTIRLTLATSTLLILHAFALHGVNYYVKTIKESIYILTFISSLANLVSAGLLSVSFRVFKSRKRPLYIYLFFACLILASFSAVMMFLRPKSDRMFIAMIFFVTILLSAAMNMQCCYVPELFPASLRVQGLGIACGLSRISVAFVDYINMTDKMVAHGFPLMIFAGIILFEMVVLRYFLPDTTGRNLDSVVDKDAGDRVD